MATRRAHHPTAFVTWAHSGEDWTNEQTKAWEKEVREFCFLLRSFGIDAEADLFHFDEPGIDWHRFGPLGIADREFTIIAVSPAWKERWEGRNAPSVGAGAAAEANELQGIFSRNQEEFRKKVVIVELPMMVGQDAVPDNLRGAQRVRVPAFTPLGMEQLIRMLTNQPKDPLPPLGPIPLLPPAADVSAPRGGGDLPLVPTPRDYSAQIEGLWGALNRWVKPEEDQYSEWWSVVADRIRGEVSDLEDQRQILRVRAEGVRLIRDEIRHILRRLNQLDDVSREWGSIWPGPHAPYHRLPAEKWNAYGAGLGLPTVDHDAIQEAYEMSNEFNQLMERGPLTFGEPEPDVDQLRQGFVKAEAIVDRVHS